MSKLFARVQHALANAKTATDYEYAKLVAEELSETEQFQIVDSFIECRRRLSAVGVL